MGLYDRDYIQPESRRQDYNLSQMRFNLPRMTPVVKWLLIANFAVFFASLVPQVGLFLDKVCAVDSRSWLTTLEPWRVLTYQFLHSHLNVWHIVMNMVGLFMLGPALERYWGSRRFVQFYLICGASGGIVYLLLSRIGLLDPGSLIGASGAILGLMAAAAILLPHFVGVLFIFPVPIRVVAVIYAAASFFTVITGGANAGGEATHFTGMVVGAAYVLLHPRLDRLVLKKRSGSWEKQVEESRRLQIEVDRILAKVHRSGLHTLTGREKKTLKRATQEEIRRHQL
jgi:membrane associated rhomboid family serine protease